MSCYSNASPMVSVARPSMCQCLKFWKNTSRSLKMSCLSRKNECNNKPQSTRGPDFDPTHTGSSAITAFVTLAICSVPQGVQSQIHEHNFDVHTFVLQDTVKAMSLVPQERVQSLTQVHNLMSVTLALFQELCRSSCPGCRQILVKLLSAMLIWNCQSFPRTESALGNTLPSIPWMTFVPLVDKKSVDDVLQRPEDVLHENKFKSIVPSKSSSVRKGT